MKRKRGLKYDLTGNTFGSLKVLSLDVDKVLGRTSWICLCVCGKVKNILGQSLRNGSTKSCGCAISKATSERQLKPLRKGSRFGKLKVVSFSHQDQWGNMRYKCKCDCGNSHIAKASCLRSGKTRSCGCGQLEAVTTHGLSYTFEYRKAAWRKRRSLTRGENSSFTAQDLRDLWREQDGKCDYCGKKLRKLYHVEHKTPLSRGGTHSKANICLACPKCNLSKFTMTAEEFHRRLENDEA